MILQLMVKDYVLFESCFIDFENGMSVITGETGAGKSLLIDAIGLLSGDRLSGNVIRKNKPKAILQMVLSSNEKIDAELTEAGFEIDENIIIQRTIMPGNKSTIRINQQITTLAFVKRLVSSMVDIHSQMDTYHIMDEKVQLELLDSYAKNDDLLDQVDIAYHEYLILDQKLNKLKNEDLSDDQLTLLTEQYNEIDAMNVQKDELDQLKQKIDDIVHWQKEQEAILDCIYALDHEDGLLDQMYNFNKYITRSKLLNNNDEIETMYYTLQSISDELKDIRDRHAMDNVSLDELQTRQYQIKQLYRKYGGSYDSLIESKAKLMDQIDSIIHRQDLLDRLEAETKIAYSKYLDLANLLSAKRKKVVDELQNKVMNNCHDLMLENARFMIDMKPKKPSADGTDAIQFLVAMNAGQNFSSLKDSASGGELARLMFALKVVFQAQKGIETIIFDEIDTGVSGKVALAMGNKMHELSKNYQVLCITHLASVAVYADQHIYVAKITKDDTTYAKSESLNHDKIIDELATMTNGNPTTSAKEAMIELWESVHNG